MILASELHKPSRKRFQTRRTVTNFKNDLWQADLVQMDKLSKYNKGYKYYLAVIDTFSKFGYAEPLKTKNMDEVAKAFEKILKANASTNATPKNLSTDQGSEFFNRVFKGLMEKYKINHYHTFTDKKAAIVERWNRTVKGRLYRKFTERNSLNWIEILQDVINEYNNKKHSTIGMAPVDVNDSNSDLIRVKLTVSKTSIAKPRFKIGEWVRISKYKNIFEKGYLTNWTEELFKVVKIRNTVPIVYELEDELGEPVKGTFYELEMLKTEIPDYFRIDKILQRRKNKDGSVDLKVTKKGHDQRKFYWIPLAQTEKL